MYSSSSASGGVSKALKACVVVVVLSGVVACGPTYRNHGYVPPQEDLDQIVVGIDTRASVEETLGSVGATSVREDNALYFVRSRVKTLALLEPEVVERDIVAVSFDTNGVVQNIETFGLERGKVVRLTRRVTDSSVGSQGFLRQLINNIGSFGPTGFGDGL
ncbi:MAG: outer membrane protein assembly factor BamE [Roseobacter sp.]